MTITGRVVMASLVGFTVGLLSLSVEADPATVSPQDFPQDCDGRNFGFKDLGALKRFDAELRTALSNDDPVVLALLARYPVRVNGPGRGSIFIDDAKTVQERFTEVFPPDISSAVLGTSPRAVACTPSGVMYGRGAVWALPEVVDGRASYYISAINLTRESDSVATPAPKLLEFVCRTSRQRIAIEVEPRYRYTLRAWNLPRSISERPDVVIEDGERAIAGTGPCAHSIWTFVGDDAKYIIGELGCTEGLEPNGSKGYIAVGNDAGAKTTTYCK